MIRDLYDAGLTYLSVSVDAWKPETYKKVRKNKLQKIIDHTLLAVKIRNELKLEFPRIRFHLLIHQRHMMSLNHFCNFGKIKLILSNVKILMIMEVKLLIQTLHVWNHTEE